MNKMIKKWRKEAGLTQQELADKLFVTKPAISQYESGKREPSLHMLEEIARICNKTLNIRIQEEFTLEKITVEHAKEQMEKFIATPGLINVEQKDIDILSNVEGNVYRETTKHYDPRKATVYAISDFYVEEKPLHKAKSVFFHMSGPCSRLAFDDADYASQRLHETLSFNANIICSFCFHEDEESEDFKVTIIALGY